MLTGPFTGSFFGGTTALLSTVPFTWPCALNGRGYLLDDKMIDAHLEKSVATLKQQQAASDEPGERSLNPEGAWRRASSSWHHGAGQTHREGDSADTFRFRSSKGIDVWTRGQLSLLDDTALAHAAAGSTVQMVASQGYLYYLNGNSVYRTDLTTTTVCTGTPVAAATGICSTGSAVYVAFGASDVWKITGTAAGGAAFVATDMTTLGAAKQRILGAHNNLLYDLSAGAATVVATNIDTAFRYVGFADGTAHIYAAGNSGDTAVIYRIAVTDDASALGAPVVAGRLTIGETVTAIFGYANLLFIGTSQGFRVAEQTSNGDLQIGPLVELGVAVNCFSAWGPHVWFGWTNYDSTSTGTGRINPGVQNETGAFAYASDVMVTGQGVVRSVAHLAGTLAIGIDTVGVHKPSGTVASGTLESGIVTFDVTEPKLLAGGTIGYTGTGSAAMQVSIDGDSYVTMNEAGMSQSGVAFETRITITGDATVTSAMMRAFPQARPTRLIFAPLVLVPSIEFRGVERAFDVAAALDDIRTLWSSKQPTTYQEGVDSYAVTVEDFEFRKINPVDDWRRWAGTVIVKMKELT